MAGSQDIHHQSKLERPPQISNPAVTQISKADPRRPITVVKRAPTYTVDSMVSSATFSDQSEIQQIHTSRASTDSAEPAGKRRKLEPSEGESCAEAFGQDLRVGIFIIESREARTRKSLWLTRSLAAKMLKDVVDKVAKRTKSPEFQYLHFALSGLDEDIVAYLGRGDGTYFGQMTSSFHSHITQKYMADSKNRYFTIEIEPTSTDELAQRDRQTMPGTDNATPDQLTPRFVL